MRSLLPPDHQAAQAELDRIIAEAFEHERWRDPATYDRYGITEDTPGHPRSGHCAWDGQPIAECGGQPATRHGWLYGSEECTPPRLVSRATGQIIPTGQAGRAA